MTSEQVQVTQADREAGGEIFRLLDNDGLTTVTVHQVLAKHRLAERERIVKWLNDHSRCPFGKSPDWYAEAIERGDHEQGEGR